MIQKLLFNKIKEYLTDNYGLDMYSADIRLAYVIYHVKMQEYHGVMPLRLIVIETYAEYADKDVTFYAFDKSVARTASKIDNSKKTINVIMSIAEKIEI